MSRQTHQLLQANVSSTQTGYRTSEKTGHGLLRGNLMDPKSKACYLPWLIHLEGETGNWSHNRQGANPLGFQSSPGKWRKAKRCWGMLGAFFLIEKSAGSGIPEVPSHWPGALSWSEPDTAPSPESSTVGLLPLLGADICCPALTLSLLWLRKTDRPLGKAAAKSTEFGGQSRCPQESSRMA